jgi:hypothetical protein
LGNSAARRITACRYKRYASGLPIGEIAMVTSCDNVLVIELFSPDRHHGGDADFRDACSLGAIEVSLVA